MKKVWKISIAAMIMTMLLGMTAYAGSWQESFKGKWWKNDDGSYPTSGWHWIDCKNDGTAECYYFDENGYVLVNTTTPDGYLVNEEGQWYVEESVNRIVDTNMGQKVMPGVIQHIQKQKTEVRGSISCEKEADSELLVGTMVSPNCKDWKFYLHVPKNVNGNMPMIVLFHDKSAGPKPLAYLKENPIFQYIMEHEEIKDSAIILFPQYEYRYDEAPKYKYVIHDYARLIQLVAKEYPVDMNRIYATGGSMGCSGTFLLCNDYPELVACGVPITWPSIVDVKNFYNYTSVPIWYIIEDENNIIDGVNKIVRIINENGAPAWVTVDTGSNHSTASGLGNGVDKFGIFNWMFTQKKN